MNTQQNEIASERSLHCLVRELKADCNRYVNGKCTSLFCLRRGGYTRGTGVKYDVATCERYEQVEALEALLPNDSSSASARTKNALD